MESLEKLEKVMNRLTNKKKQEDIKFVLTLGEKVVVKSIIEQTADSIQGRVIKGSEINETR
ncbi:Phage protein [Bacillus sp. GeD10]|nr:Phage protein [Bacillus sp. GeD10]